MLRAIAGMLACSAVMFAAETGDHGGGDPLLLWKIVNFGILAAGLGYLIVKFAKPAYRERAAGILEQLNVAAQRSQEAAAQAAEVESKLAGLAADVSAARQAALDEMQTEAERIRAETVAQIAKVEENAQAAIESAGRAARQELRAYSAHLAVELAVQNIQARMNVEVQRALVDQFVDKLDQAGAKGDQH